MFETFKYWVSSYFEVPEGWAGSINELDSRKRTERTTVDSWSQEEHDRFFSQDGAARAEMHWCVADIGVLRNRSTHHFPIEYQVLRGDAEVHQSYGDELSLRRVNEREVLPQFECGVYCVR